MDRICPCPGGCLYKGLNRAMATVTGGGMALGVQWMANRSGKDLEPIIVSGSLFLFGAFVVIHVDQPQRHIDQFHLTNRPA